MKIGDLATASGTPTDTIRYYEREGLLPAAARTEANYRQYEKAHLEQLLFIRHCRNLDMSLDEVRELLAVRNAPEAGCETANRVLDEHISHVSHRIRELRALERQLKELRGRCATSKSSDECGILVSLAEPAMVPEASVQGAARAGRHLSNVHASVRSTQRHS
ncbi:Cd(II)/Pb(II)-responsive transcriptional regulator [Ottowia thiooxydans]|uniref:Cd(II)/Pb(II)-responsive transcriptional regulator n=1 Tax=Ottowia thiooxydans TaxID=219182 RepID=UPI00041BB1DA|nr:Cd(II)/Pb(II)-responsive transcriptional regulator [Ottowia thiooxydans]